MEKSIIIKEVDNLISVVDTIMENDVVSITKKYLIYLVNKEDNTNIKAYVEYGNDMKDNRVNILLKEYFNNTNKCNNIIEINLESFIQQNNERN